MKLRAGPGTGDKESALLRAIIDLITSEENTNWVSFSRAFFTVLYRKIPKISPGAYIFQRPFLRGLYSERLMYGGKFAFKNRLG